MLRDVTLRSDGVRNPRLLARPIDQFIVERIEQEVVMMTLIVVFEHYISRNKDQTIQPKTKLKWSMDNTRKIVRLPGFSCGNPSTLPRIINVILQPFQGSHWKG